MIFKLFYHPDVKVDLKRVDKKFRKRIQKAIESRLVIAPHLHGKPLRKTLKGYWKMRVGDYRIVFKIAKDEIWILAILHRKDVYKIAVKRTL